MSLSSDVDFEALVLLTLAYTAQFGFPLTREEILMRVPFRKITSRQLDTSLKKLLQKKLIEKSGEFFFLKGQKDSVVVRKERQKLSNNKWSEVEQLKQLLRWLPAIDAIGITGSLAMDNFKTGADVDVIILVKKNRLWLTRLGVAVLSWLAGKRRTWSGEEADSWCFNLWLDEAALELGGERRSIYGAYEACQIKWVDDRRGRVKEFYLKNNWIDEFLPNFYQEKVKNLPKDAGDTQFQIGILTNWLINKVIGVVEFVVFLAQYIYMKPHMTREEVGLHKAFFHPRPTQNIVFHHWQKMLIGLGLDT